MVEKGRTREGRDLPREKFRKIGHWGGVGDEKTLGTAYQAAGEHWGGEGQKRFQIKKNREIGKR